MKNVLIGIVAILCSMSVSAQRYKKVESKAKTYAEKYERVGNELTISFVAENIPMSKAEIYSAFTNLLDKQFKIKDSDIEFRDALGKTLKCSQLCKVLESGPVHIKSNIDMKLSAKDGRARISLTTNGYSFYKGNNVDTKETVCSRPPFVDLDNNSDKGAQLTEFYCNAFLQLDGKLEEIIKLFADYWQKPKK